MATCIHLYRTPNGRSDHFICLSRDVNNEHPDNESDDCDDCAVDHDNLERMHSVYRYRNSIVIVHPTNSVNDPVCPSTPRGLNYPGFVRGPGLMRDRPRRESRGVKHHGRPSVWLYWSPCLVPLFE